MEHRVFYRNISKYLLLIASFVMLSLFHIAFGYALTTKLQGQSDAQKNIEAEPIKILIFGDSLVAGYGLPEEKGFVKVMNVLLISKGHNVELYNGGVSGNTVTDGKERIDWVLGADDFDGVLITLGGNDMLRGIDPAFTRLELDDVITAFKAKNLHILLTGIIAPINLGKEYGESFNSIYPDLSQKHDLILYPFFLEGVATNEKLNLNDGLHPNEEGVKYITNRILPYMEKLINKITLDNSKK